MRCPGQPHWVEGFGPVAFPVPPESGGACVGSAPPEIRLEALTLPTSRQLMAVGHDYYQKASMKINISHGGVCIFMLGVLLSCDPAAYVRPFFGLHGVALQSYKELLSSYEAASWSYSWAGQLEGELKAHKKKEAHEEGVLQRRLKNRLSEHTTLQERYGVSVRRTEAVRATFEGVQTERDSTMRERDAAVKERDSLRAGKDEILQTDDRLLDQLTESQRQAQVIEATMEGANGLEELARLEEAELEVPATLWASVRDDVSSSDPLDP
ncbi:hypothetical protein LIER_33043 [Lithospermum erythrorhizon]|uniref:Uncharacterized protein n=1 Tax=Lithospermum erythrorhizon TaxID=34254 RepID=A0AAV3RY25_LITER